jgi:hypothetical protein
MGLVAMLDGTLRHWPVTASVYYCEGFSVRGSQSEHVISTLILHLFCRSYAVSTRLIQPSCHRLLNIFL